MKIQVTKEEKNIVWMCLSLWESVFAHEITKGRVGEGDKDVICLSMFGEIEHYCPACENITDDEGERNCDRCQDIFRWSNDYNAIDNEIVVCNTQADELCTCIFEDSPYNIFLHEKTAWPMVKHIRKIHSKLEVSE